jgi:glycosyltransferase involved in cell wall biosynthesis
MEPVMLDVAAIIPCLDEEAAIFELVSAVRAQGIATVIVVDGGSRDRTAARAAEAGALVVHETRRGYGRAVQSGIAALPAETRIVLFLDGDGSDPPERIQDVLAPILAGRAVFVHGTRIKGLREPGALSPQQVAAGRIAEILLRLFYGARFSDMSPFRAIRRDALDGLGMREETYGWNLEMLMRVAAAGGGSGRRAALPPRGGVQGFGEPAGRRGGLLESRDYVPAAGGWAAAGLRLGGGAAPPQRPCFRTI